jgi:TatD-related deoxyribonuclease
MSIPIFDNHIHLHPKGRNIEAVKDFTKAGGTHLVLCHLPYEEIPIVDGEDFRRSYQITIDMADQCRKATSAGIEVTVGPYPVLLIGLSDRYGLTKAVDIMKKGMAHARDLVSEGLAIGIGEIGRPHFPVSEEIWTASNDIMLYGMELASDVDCPVVLHTESATPESMKEIAAMADKAGIDRSKVVKHYSPPLILPEENSGLFPSVLASRPSVAEALKKGSRFMLETDFLDDVERPGAVLAITTVPKRTLGLLQSGAMSEEQAYAIHKDNPRKVYGIDVRE